MLYLAGISHNSIVDGPGIRTTFFAQGCPHHCPSCQNPATWAFEGGTPYTPEALLAMVEADPLVHGVTLSGGEPFAQGEGFAALAALLKAKGYEVAAYTGYTLEQLLQAGTPAHKALLSHLDVLVDGPFVEAKKSLELAFRGSANQRILDVPASLAAGQAVRISSTRWRPGEIV